MAVPESALLGWPKHQTEENDKSQPGQCWGLEWHIVDLAETTKTTMRRAEASMANGDGCSNGDVYPPEWISNPEMTMQIFYDTAQQCCDFFNAGRECQIYESGCRLNWPRRKQRRKQQPLQQTFRREE